LEKQNRRFKQFAGRLSKFAHRWDSVVASLWSDLEREWYESGRPLPLHETGFNVKPRGFILGDCMTNPQRAGDIVTFVSMKPTKATCPACGPHIRIELRTF
jgi:hypothetical protein